MMDDANFLSSVARLLAALVFVLALMGGLAFLLRRFNGHLAPALSGSKRRLQILESLIIGPRHRAVLLQRDDHTHLVILGPASEAVVESFAQASEAHETKAP